jgi:Uma2 family endonuclease
MGEGSNPRSGMTVDEYAALPEGDTTDELVRGRLVREPQPGYEHGRRQVRLAALIDAQLLGLDADCVCVGPVGFVLSEMPATVRGPDLAIVRRERLGELHAAGFVIGAPEIAIEIVSPSNTRRQLAEKTRDYLDAGAECVWLVDPAARTVTVQRGRRRIVTLAAGDVLTGGRVVPGLALPIAAIFED